MDQSPSNDLCEISCELKDCIKELDFSTISFMITNPNATFDELMQDVINRVPLCFSDPEHICARFTIGSKVIQTANFTPCICGSTTPIKVGCEPVGTLNVGYLGTVNEKTPPFAEDDNQLIKAMADRIGIIAHSNSLKTSVEQSEKRYRTLIDNALVGITQSTLNGYLLYANAKAVNMFGFANLEEGMKVSPLSRYRNPQDRENLIQTIQQAGKVDNFEVELTTKTGNPIFALFSATLDGDVITIMMMDITERKLVEKEHRAKSLKLQEVNTALKVLLEQRQKDKAEIEETILFNIRKLILPYLDAVKQRPLDDYQKTYLDVLETNLNNIINPFGQKLMSTNENLTPQEMKVADFIRNGKTVKEISAALGVSETTINFHRQRIRKKLGLTNHPTNLRTYLLSFT